MPSLHQLGMVYDRLKRPADADRVRKQHEATMEALATLTLLNREADARPWDAAVRIKLAEANCGPEKPQLAAMWRRAAEARNARAGSLPR